MDIPPRLFGPWPTRETIERLEREARALRAAAFADSVGRVWGGLGLAFARCLAVLPVRQARFGPAQEAPSLAAVRKGRDKSLTRTPHL